MRDGQDVQYILARPRRQKPALHVRARRMLFILLAALLYIPAVVVSVTTLISGEHWWGIGAQPNGNLPGAWQVTWSDRGLSSSFNIEVGDQILAADGHPPQSEDEINQADELEIFSSGATAAHPVRWRAPSQLDTLLSFSWYILGVVSLLLGSLVFLHATDRALALRFFLLWTTLALASSLSPATSFGNLLAVHIDGILYVGLATGLLASFLWRLLLPVPLALDTVRGSIRPLTPEKAGKSLKYRWVAEVPLVTGLGVVAVYLAAITMKRPDVLEQSNMLAAAQTILAVGLSLSLILRASLSRRAAVARERARMLLGGMLLGLLPPLILTVIPQLLVGQPLVSGTVSTLAIVVLPFSFAYAIVRRELLRLDSLIRNTAVIALTVIGLVIGAVLLAEVLSLLHPVPALVIGIIAGAVLAPFILAAAREITEAWLFPQVRLYRHLIAQGERIGRTPSPPRQSGGRARPETRQNARWEARPSARRSGLDPGLVVGQLVGEVHLALPVRQVAVFVPEPHSGQLLEALPLPPQSKPGDPAPAQPPQTPGAPRRILSLEERVAALLSREGHPLLVEPATLHEEVGVQPDLESWHLLVPMRVQDRLVGVLALSRREDDQDYSATDVRLLRFLAGRRVLALDYALLYAELSTAYEKRQEIDRLKDQFIITAHHELRTPLTGVQGYLELLRELGPQGRAARPEEVEVFIERACRAADELNEQLDSLLAAAETNISQENLKPRPVYLYQIASRAIASLEALAQRGRHRVSNSIPQDLIAVGDEEALYRIFLNLLSNALKYSPEGRAVLFDGYTKQIQAPTPLGISAATEVSRPGARPMQVAEVIVRDWGVGIAKADQHKIFERFTRLERDLNSPVRGSGLGLAICKELLEAMGGAIWVESEGIRGAGSTFYVRLPLAESTVMRHVFVGWEDQAIMP